MLRGLLFADNDTFFVTSCRRLSPLTTKENAKRFFEACEKLFLDGPRLGAVSEIQVPNVTNNYLVDGFFKFIQITGMFAEGLAVLESVLEKEPEVVTLISKLLLLQNEEVKAVERMNKGILENPRDAFLLELQSKFCQDKNRLDLALDCAIRAVNSAPSEFITWARLVEVYIQKGDYEQALLTLNSCPMFTYHEVDSHRMPVPAKSHFPLPTTGVIDEIWAVDINADNEVSDPSLLRLTAPTLRATFAKAYDLLTQIVARIGWDKLLKYRSNVFVMELEYRKDKNEKKSGHETEDKGGESKPNTDKKESSGKEQKISDKSDSKISDTDYAVLSNGSSDQNGGVNGESTPNGGLERPPTATTGTGTVSTSPALEASSATVPVELRNKRLCERWLDHLFMVLYDDLRTYTVWRTEMVHYQSQQLPYVKSALEWEIYGMVAHRLKHQDEAIDAFQKSMEVKFSDRVLWKLLDCYAPEEKAIPVNIPAALDAVVNLTAWNHRWYTDFSPKLLIALEKVITSEGLVKVRSKIDAKYSPQGVVAIVNSILNTLALFELPGTEY
ncbi:Bud7p [Sugiyamaella lignohabitans]|uniref:Bud7p n=1 Tax=Sugiyamaella lignohabitans TaxID=796027 RepID=A0A170QYI9_9ASCO|nr:Bud7p [Sugiyamaella lignohabitans]ANB15979.1 Bud7p [Sugiyamaella lignohabitans]